jgi:endonuclease YncB( thermonuclease family)
VGHHPRRHRRLRPAPRSAPPGLGRGPLRRPVVPVEAPDVDEEGKPTGTTHTVERDEGLRETTLEKLATLKPVAREDGVHTAGNSSQISDGAAAVLMMTREKADALGLTPRARVVDTCLVGVDPVLMLTGPIDATQRLLGPHRPVDRRHRHLRDQRGVRLGGAGLGQGGRRRPGQAPTPTAAPSPSATPRRHRRLPHHQGAHELERTDGATPSSRCAAAAASAPAPSSVSRRLVGLLGALALVGACAEDPGAPTPAGTARILSVVDGDTVVVRVEGASETVRLIGIDTPETNHPTRPVECYGAEATAVATELVPPGTTVRLERDVEPATGTGASSPTSTGPPTDCS